MRTIATRAGSPVATHGMGPAVANAGAPMSTSPTTRFRREAVVGAVILLASAAGCAPRNPRAVEQIPARPKLGVAIDRVGRPLTANAFVGLLRPDEESDARKETYNRAPPREWPEFIPDIQRSLGLYDGFDGACGNQWLAGRDDAAARYGALAALLADDRLWVDTRATRCTRFFAVELTSSSNGPADDCGGRTPGDDAVDVIRSMLVDGSRTSVTDGVDRDDHVHSMTEFPFLAAP